MALPPNFAERLSIPAIASPLQSFVTSRCFWASVPNWVISSAHMLVTAMPTEVDAHAAEISITASEYETTPAPAPPDLPLTGHAGCIDEMLTAIRSGTQPSTCGADNIRSLAIIHAAIASAGRGGARVAIADL